LSDLAFETNTISPLVAILWCFYPMAALVAIELVLRYIRNDDDDDQGGGKGIRVDQLQPVPVPSGA